MKKSEFEEVITYLTKQSNYIPIKYIIKNPYKWVKIISSNINDFDNKTRIFLLDKLKDRSLDDYLLNKFKKLRVIFINEECLMSVRESVNFHNGIIPMGMGFGNYIIINATKISRESFLSRTEEFMGLVGHETIHTIQSDCFSSLYEFKRAYFEQKKIHNNSYVENPYEIAAFRFGGYKRRSDIKRHFNQLDGWWK